MTCEEFDAALDTDPMEATIATHAAVVLHAKNCPACRAKVTREDAEAATLRPETKAYVDAAAFACNVRCLADSEFVEMVYGHPKESAENLKNRVKSG